MAKKIPPQNPYSTIGLDKFASLKAELSAKREDVIEKTGTPEALVRFASSGKGWIPLVVENGKDGAPRVSIRAPIKTQQNPYTTRGLDKFASLKAELSAKREYVMKKTGTPEALVRFSSSGKGWIPLVVENGKDGPPSVSILAPIKTRQNPYTARGLDKFASLKAELSAKREYVIEKTGTPEALVRFSYSRKGWIPLVVQDGADGAPRVSILPPIKTQQKKENDMKNNNNSEDKEDDKNNEAKAEIVSENDGRISDDHRLWGFD